MFTDMPLWAWIVLVALAAFAVWQQFRVYQIGRESKKREELFQIVTENAADMIALVDVKGRRLYNSPAYKRILGYSAAELGETSAFEQIHPDDRFKVLQAAQQARTTGVGQKLEYRIRHRDGSWRVLESVAGTIRDEKGEVSKLVIVNRDVTDRKHAEERAEHNSFHDGLTGLANRRLFLERLQNLFNRAQRSPERQYALLFVDLDGFKVFNDTMGPAVGDEVLAEVGRRIGSCLRDEDLVSRTGNDLSTHNAVLSRMGGDEFTILLEDLKDPSDAMRVGQRMLAAISAIFLVQGRELRTSASIGIALSTLAHERAEELLQEADVAMRRAKAMGGARCEVFDEAMHTRAISRLKLEAELRHALEKKQFRLHYQAIVNLKTARVEAFEALLRWQHPEQGLISPYKFIAAAEDRGLLVSIGQWAIEQACQQACEWNAAHDRSDVCIAVNLSRRQLADGDFVNAVVAALRSTAIDPACLHFEIAEKVAARDPRQTAHVIANLKKLGVGVILDDFGAGNSSLMTLPQFQVDGWKIDRSLIQEMFTDRAVAEIVELIIFLARKLNMTVTAEGIENAKQRDRLRELGCDLGQGFLFSQPLAAEAAGELLRQPGVRRVQVAGLQL
jgi:diguanylate cyclase (GGDEF)-like protein/PAS domain S-box-containing protein